ncbi:unnamed protein product [Heterobilharzia americana]|nr:unnamed protein product [Heterobilharzia americana]
MHSEVCKTDFIRGNRLQHFINDIVDLTVAKKGILLPERVNDISAITIYERNDQSAGKRRSQNFSENETSNCYTEGREEGLYILAELSLLKLKHPSGVFVSPCEDDLLKWLGLISIRSGYYFGGVFSFVLLLPDDFPSTKMPKLYLPEGFYHPHVDCVTGEVNLCMEFPVWNPNKHHIWHLLHYFKRMLTSPTTNALIHHPEEYDNEAKFCVTKLSVWSGSTQNIPSLNVSGWTSDSLLNDARNMLQKCNDCKLNEDIVSQGFSWIDPKVCPFLQVNQLQIELFTGRVKP